MYRSFFSSGTPVWGERFFGRKQELNNLLTRLEGHQAVNFFSLRKMGKSSLLRQIQYLLEGSDDWKHYQAVYIDLQAIAGHGPGHGLVDRLSWMLDISPTGNIRTESAWRRIEQYVRDRGIKLLLLLDECEVLLGQGADESERAIMRALQQSEVLNVVASTAYKSIADRIDDSVYLGSSFANIFSFFRLPTFLPEEAEELLITLCERGGVTLVPDLAKELAYYGGYYPHIIQELGHHAFSHLSGGQSVSVAEIAAHWRKAHGDKWLFIIVSAFKEGYEGTMSELMGVKHIDFLLESLSAYGMLLPGEMGDLTVAPYLKDLLQQDSTEPMLERLQILAESYKFAKRKTHKAVQTAIDLPIYIEKGEVTMGNKFVAGDNVGGIQNVGNFQNVISNLNSVGQNDLAKALNSLTDAIMKSQSITDDKKKENVEVISAIGEEMAKANPNGTLLKMLSNGLLSTLKAVPDVAKAAASLAPLLSKYIS